MLRFECADERWWNKPLVRFAGRVLPAELAALASELQPGEAGAWLNSRGTKSGVIDLIRVGPNRFETQRIDLPAFVSVVLVSLYRSTGLAKGAPDLVLWRCETSSVRFAEVKCPHWDEPTEEQRRFAEAARERGAPTIVCEWEFQGSAGLHPAAKPAPAFDPARSGRSPRTR